MVEELEILVLGMFANLKIIEGYLTTSRLMGNDYTTLIEIKRNLLFEIGGVIELCVSLLPIL
jgi:hypothetical protein